MPARAGHHGSFDVAAFAGDVVTALATILATQRQVVEELEALSEEVAALQAGHLPSAPDEALLRAGPEALRREAGQARRHSQELVARSRALLERAEQAERRYRALIDRDDGPGRRSAPRD